MCFASRNKLSLFYTFSVDYTIYLLFGNTSIMHRLVQDLLWLIINWQNRISQLRLDFWNGLLFGDLNLTTVTCLKIFAMEYLIKIVFSMRYLNIISGFNNLLILSGIVISSLSSRKQFYILPFLRGLCKMIFIIPQL